MTYGGHQFGNWAGQLGDGRAIALGEVTTPSGSHQVLQLKGAGPTPYSRGADGRAVLRSSIREFLCSEAMHHLGVPTTRALSLTLTGDEVVRDMLYDGHPAPEHGAVVCRVAPSFVRFGHFELPASRGEVDLLRQLVEHTVHRHFPHLLAGKPPTGLPMDRRDGTRHRRSDHGMVPRSHGAHGRSDGRLDARRFRARRDEYRQSLDPRAHHRLRPLRMARRLRPRLDTKHHRRRRQALPLRQPTQYWAVESQPARRRALHRSSTTLPRSNPWSTTIPPVSATPGSTHWPQNSDSRT